MAEALADDAVAAADVAGLRPDDEAGSAELTKLEELDCGPMTTVRVNEYGSVKYVADT